jgi:tetratricopeptide (TPR) repeat protein
VVWDDKGEHDRAMADFQQAIALDPTISDSFNNRGTVESSTGKFEQAKNDFYRALSINANSTTALENLAFFQATCPDPNYRNGKKAFDNASLAYQLDGGGNPFDTDVPLAAAYAEFGDFNQAVVWQQKVVDAAPAQYKAMMIARLEQFKQHKPYRSVQRINAPAAPIALAIPAAMPTPALPAPVAAAIPVTAPTGAALQAPATKSVPAGN